VVIEIGQPSAPSFDFYKLGLFFPASEFLPDVMNRLRVLSKRPAHAPVLALAFNEKIVAVSTILKHDKVFGQAFFPTSWILIFSHGASAIGAWMSSARLDVSRTPDLKTTHRVLSRICKGLRHPR
jgi:hypothetical protein